MLLLHGVVGTLSPASGFSASQAAARPWLWTGVHAGFLLTTIGVHAAARRWAGARRAELRRRREQLAAEERAVVARLQEAEEVKDRLLSVTWHELRTPLTAIVGLTRTLAAYHDTLDRARLAACVEGMQEHTDRLSRLVDNLVDAASDDAPASGASVEVAPVVADLVDGLPGTALPFEVCVPRGVRVAVDERVTRRILGNLFENAAKFAVPGTLATVACRTTGTGVEVAVTNTVQPMDEAAIHRLGDHLLDPFVQGDSSDTRPAEGLGLGLHVARKAAEAHGGWVCLRLAGGRFTAAVTLPAVLDLSLVEKDAPPPVLHA